MNDGQLRVSSHVRASVTGDGLVLLDVHGGLLLASNGVGAHIWQLIEQREPPDAIAQSLAESYGVALDRAERDVASFLAALAARGLVTTDALC